jgi:phosphoribosylformylglycinamidine synthase subunit PurQ / glutaminase
MTQAKALILRAAGTNCDLETQHAFELAGATADRLHINSIIKDKSVLDGYQILVFPGGFSYGDDVAAGKILANQIFNHLYEPVQQFIEKGKLILGICNGFQVLLKAGILPGGELSKNKLVTITNNDSGKYDDRWVYLEPQSERCVFIQKGMRIYLPIAHAEGKIVTKDAQALEKLKNDGHIAFKYVDANSNEGNYPVNPNGSIESIAGLTDSTGRVLGLMPHPERFIRPTQHPHWSRLENRPDGQGMTIFQNAVKYVQQNFSK